MISFSTLLLALDTSHRVVRRCWTWLVLGAFVCLGPAAAQTPQRLAPSAVRQVQALQSIKSAKSDAQSKIDSRLYLGMLHQQNDPRLAPLTDFRFVTPEDDGRVPVQVVVTSADQVKSVIDRLDSLDAVVRHFSIANHLILARVRLSDLGTLASMNQVRRIRQVIPSYTNAVNVSEGDVTHGADTARAFYGTFGAGVKVCAISDGVDSLASLQMSGDLPAVDVLPGQAGSGDEGSAMLEIIHDLAPAATLGFASANPTEDQFAQNILDLATAGCDIIVDDIIYLDESPFEDGPVAQAVNTVTGAGVLYFSSAGNEGNAHDLTSGTWEGDFAPSAATDPTPLTGANLHDFGDGGNSILVEFGGGNPPLLIWAEHYDLNTGNASTDYDLYDMDGALTTIFDASTNTQDGTGGDDFPIEFIGGGAFGGERLLIDLFADGTTSSRPMFNLIVFRGELDDALATNGATRGHSATVNAFSTAATPAADSFDGVSAAGPYPGIFTSANESESFTSDGPRRIILDTSGNEITPGNRTSTGGTVRQKPNITAADGVMTAAPGFNPFYGTSAAAPHAAAIAALVKSAVPAATPTDIRNALLGSAIDIEDAGVDNSTGVGIVMAEPALQAAGATPMAYLDTGMKAISESTGDGDAYIEPNETWDLSIPLTNVGGASASAISGVLSSSTPGVSVVSANSTYSDLAVSNTAPNDTPYSIFVSSAVGCGAPIDLTLTVTYSGGSSPQTFDLSLGTGAPGTPATFNYTGPVVPIPDGTDLSGTSPGAAVSATLPVSGVVGGIYDVDFSIDGDTCDTTAGSTTVGLDHSFVSDLELTLTSPGSTSVLVINHTDGSGNNFCQTVLNDESAGPSIQSVVSGDAPFTGSFTPSASLAAFDGEDPNGNWDFQAQDFFEFDSGNIRAFSLTVTPAICDAPALASSFTVTKSASGGPFDVGAQVTYTVTLTNNGAIPQADNPGDEFTDVLPAQLGLVSASATSGVAVANTGTNTVSWNGSLAAGGGTVTITIVADILPSANGTVVSNQGMAHLDSIGDGTNDLDLPTDDPGVGGTTDPTNIMVGAQSVLEIPTVSTLGLTLLGLMLAALGLLTLRRI